MKKLLAFILFIVVAAPAQVLPRVNPEEVGLSAARLARIDQVVREDVAQKKIAGAVTLIARKGKIAQFGVYGMADIEAHRPMREDTIFRIASMTKPITSTAVMMLYEEGKFMLHDPIGKYLPEFSKMEVLPPPGATNNYRVPAKRPITIRNLLTHTSGLTYHWNPRLGSLYSAYKIPHGLDLSNFTLAEACRRLALLPLLFQPGEHWEYGLSIDVLGRLVEVASGMTLDEFFRKRIFGPLGMKDTCFYLPKEKVSRLAAVYGSEKDKPLYRQDGAISVGSGEGTTVYPYSGPRKYFSGGGGLSSTALDYARFAQMILNGGELGGARLLSPLTVRLMTMDHAGKIVKDGSAPSFGYGFSVDSAERGFAELTSDGTHGWGGFWYTQFFISPKEDMIGVFMAQLYPSNGLELNQKFKVLAHQAVVE